VDQFELPTLTAGNPVFVQVVIKPRGNERIQRGFEDIHSGRRRSVLT
jgi:hypothetical protein